MLDLNKLQPGDRVIILLHPIHWHKGSEYADIESFYLPGQISCSIDSSKSAITVVMPSGEDKGSLRADYTLSPGAYAKVEGKLQVNKSSINNFNKPVIYKVYAENRSIQKEWLINVKNAKNSACDFLSFTIPGLTKWVFINKSRKTIVAEVDESADLKHLPVSFVISPGARTWIGNNEQFSNSGTVNFSGDVKYRILAEDGTSSCTWTVTVRKEKKLTGLFQFRLPEMFGMTVNDNTNVEVNHGKSKNIDKPPFIFSDNSFSLIEKLIYISVRLCIISNFISILF